MARNPLVTVLPVRPTGGAISRVRVVATLAPNKRGTTGRDGSSGGPCSNVRPRKS
eukprot:m.116397 g.116397  ORF g.116397 m.116397 type:complete len:55 (+) comp13131_c0_seq6:625-789(+)